jgi:hypothetical protein
MFQILWQPETGECASCGAHGDIRRFTSNWDVKSFFHNLLYNFKVCLSCWSRMQSECSLNKHEWYDDSAFILEVETNRNGITQEQHIWN